MKRNLATFLCCVAFALAQTTRGGDEAAAKPEQNEPVKIKRGPNGNIILTLDEAAPKRLGLAVANPVATSWQPEIRATGRVVDPAPLLDLLLEMSRAEMVFDTAHQEWERAKKLKKDDNISERVFQDAEANYRQNFAAVMAIHQKISAVWGRKIPEMMGPIVVPPGTERKPDNFLKNYPLEEMLIRVDLPVGERMKNMSQAARIVSLSSKIAPVTAYCFDVLPAVDSQTQQQGILFVAETSATNQLTSGEAVTAFVKTAESSLAGVTIPAEAILRHENKGWVFVQTGATEFTRQEVQLDRAVAGGFFSAELSATNRVVVTGAQTLLSAEASGGNFNSGQRD
jgi:hypothetical protein